MEEKEKVYSFAMELLAELRRRSERLVIIIFVELFVIAALFGYIFYDRWLDSQTETEYTITTDSDIHQDNMTNSYGGGHSIITNNK